MAYVSLGLGLLRTPHLLEDFMPQNNGDNGPVDVEGGEDRYQNMEDAET